MQRFWSGTVDSVYHKFVLWVSDEALSVLRIDSTIFIDATFRVTPAPFAQCLIVMNHDPTTNIFVPCAWALMTGKNETLYCEVLHALLVLLKYRWEPKVAVADFEQALLNSVKYQFPRSKIVGCFFHFQQAVFRKMKRWQSQTAKRRSPAVC